MREWALASGVDASLLEAEENRETYQLHYRRRSGRAPKGGELEPNGAKDTTTKGKQ